MGMLIGDRLFKMAVAVVCLALCMHFDHIDSLAPALVRTLLPSCCAQVCEEDNQACCTSDVAHAFSITKCYTQKVDGLTGKWPWRHCASCCYSLHAGQLACMHPRGGLAWSLCCRSWRHLAVSAVPRQSATLSLAPAKRLLTCQSSASILHLVVLYNQGIVFTF